nr:MAG TPA: hypothetical protein [Caudoviricetes sp.]
MRPDAHRWIRPDAARFLLPGTDPASVYPALERKYSPNQPRVPAGNPDGGQWTSGNSAGSNSETDAAVEQTNGTARPMGNIDFGDLASEIGNLGLFEIAPRERDNSDYAQLAGDVPEGDTPGIGHNEGPPLEPPEIPSRKPEYGGEYMRFVRQAAEWVRWVGRYTPYANAFFGALEQIDETNALVNTIKSANDPPRSLEELQDRVNLADRSGYHRHHIAEEKAARTAGFSEDLIQGRNNVVLVPILKHIEISRYYSTKVEQTDGAKLSPRDQLKDKDFETRWQFGLVILRRYEVLK